MSGPTALHASCVAVEGRGLLILGPSGSGKSALALQLMALGATLVADDRTEVWAEDEQVMARCPTPIRGLIEARGVGILHAAALDQAPLHLVVDLGRAETQRLPPNHQISVCGRTLDLVLHRPERHFPAALLQYLRGGRNS